jgi:lipopolysaccharide transport system ATP-binding protein
VQDWLIQAQDLSKKFSTSLGQAMHYGLRDALRRLLGRERLTALRPGEFWAVDHVSFEVRRGQCLAILGANGSGKTTLLRLLQGVFAPDAGQVRLRGRVGALIAAGAGFSPVLTGRENIYVSASLLGLSRRDIHERLDEILAFADVGDFLDAPLRHYSSGMQVRLGFAIAALSQPEVLLIDEALAVGDMRFQKKCYEHLHRLKRQGTAILLVSHSMGAVWALCDQGLLLERGRIAAAGPVEEVIRAYKDRSALPSTALSAEYGGCLGGTGEAVVTHTRTLSPRTGRPSKDFHFGEGLVLESMLEVHVPLRRPIFRYTLDAVHCKTIACLDSFEEQLDVPELQPGRYRLCTLVRRQNLMPGAYTLNVAVCRRDLGVHLFFRLDACRFRVLQPRDACLQADDHALIHLPSRFALEPVSQHAVKQATELLPIEFV